MTQKFKVGDLVYCRFNKRKGIVSKVDNARNCIVVKSIDLASPWSFIYSLKGELFYDGFIHLRKVKTFTSQDMLDFANYCIGEGFTSDAKKRDLVNFLNSRKENKS